MICQFLILNCSSSDSITSIISPFFTSLGLKFTVKIQLSLSNLCDETPFSSSRALPILFGHPNQRNPLRISIPSTSKVAVFIYISFFISFIFYIVLLLLILQLHYLYCKSGHPFLQVLHLVQSGIHF